MSNQLLKSFFSAAERDGVTHLKGAITEEEKKAALRFCETCEDGEGYDVPKAMMKRLAELDLVVRKSGGWYEGASALAQLQTESQDSN